MARPSPLLASGRRAREAARELATVPTSAKDEALLAGADRLEEGVGDVLEANAADLARAESIGATPAGLDRLRLTPARVESMAAGLRKVAALPDPVGEVVEGSVRPNGLRVTKVRVPLGVVGVIYENRPNVTSDAAGLCLKSGNAVMLRGSSAAIRSNLCVASALGEGVAKAGLPEAAIVMLDDASHSSAIEFMQLTGIVDCLIPRGGPGLVSSVREHARVPYVIDGDGNCHVYVDRDADLDMAVSIVVNAKASRPSVCNAAESLLVHQAVAERLLLRLADELAEVEMVGDERTRAVLPGVEMATDADYAAEYLALKLSVKVVDDLDQAVAHISRYGSGHSEAIVTTDLDAAERFVREVDAAAVLVNASTRFVDGEELGLGAEIGISTQKLHARGPLGLRELTTPKYVVRGEGQVRV